MPPTTPPSARPPLALIALIVAALWLGFGLWPSSAREERAPIAPSIGAGAGSSVAPNATVIMTGSPATIASNAAEEEPPPAVREVAAEAAPSDAADGRPRRRPLIVRTLANQRGEAIGGLEFELWTPAVEGQESLRLRGRTDDDGFCRVEIDERFLANQPAQPSLTLDPAAAFDERALVLGHVSEVGYCSFPTSVRLPREPVEAEPAAPFPRGSNTVDSTRTFLLFARRGATARVRIVGADGRPAGNDVTTITLRESPDDGSLVLDARAVRVEPGLEPGVVALHTATDWDGALTAYSGRLGRGAIWNLALRVDEPLTEHVLHLSGWSRIAGRVVDPEGTPVAELKVEATLVEEFEAPPDDEFDARFPKGVNFGFRDSLGESEARAWTGEDGAFELRGLRPGWYRLATDALGRASGSSLDLVGSAVSTADEHLVVVHRRPRLFVQRDPVATGRAESVKALSLESRAPDAWPDAPHVFLLSANGPDLRSLVPAARETDSNTPEGEAPGAPQRRRGQRAGREVFELEPGGRYLFGHFGGSAPARAEGLVVESSTDTLVRSIDVVPALARARLRVVVTGADARRQWAPIGGHQARPLDGREANESTSLAAANAPDGRDAPDASDVRAGSDFSPLAARRRATSANGASAAAMTADESRAEASEREARDVGSRADEQLAREWLPARIELQAPELDVALVLNAANGAPADWRLPPGRYRVVARALDWPTHEDLDAGVGTWLGRAEALVELSPGEERELRLVLPAAARLRVEIGGTPDEVADSLPTTHSAGGLQLEPARRRLWLALESTSSRSIRVLREGGGRMDGELAWAFRTDHFSAPLPPGEFLLVARHASGWTRRVPVILFEGRTTRVRIPTGAD